MLYAVKEPDKTRPALLQRPLIIVALSFLGSSFVGFVFAGHYYLQTTSMQGAVFSFEKAFLFIAGWWMWIALAPLVLYLASRFPLKRGMLLRNLLVHLMGWLTVTALDVGAFTSIMVLTRGPWPGLSPLTEFLQSFVASVTVDLLAYALLVAMAHAFQFYRDAQERETRAAQLQMQLSKARLQSLEMQLHPHFLFNTLNTIYVLMEDDREGARRMVTALSDLLRVTLEASDQVEVSLAQEIRFVERYLEIQKMRFGDRITVRYDIEVGTEQSRVPNMLLQPLVENAVKHGMAPDGPTEIVIRSALREGRLVLTVQDNGPGLSTLGDGMAVSGLGLRNTRDRLTALYGPSDSELIMESPEGGGFRVVAMLPFETVPDQSHSKMDSPNLWLSMRNQDLRH